MCEGARKDSDTAGAAAADLAAARTLAADGRGAPKRRRGSPGAALAFFARTGDVFMSSGGKVSSTLLNVCLKPVPFVSGAPRGVNSLFNICFQSVEEPSNCRHGSTQGSPNHPNTRHPNPASGVMPHTWTAAHGSSGPRCFGPATRRAAVLPPPLSLPAPGGIRRASSSRAPGLGRASLAAQSQRLT